VSPPIEALGDRQGIGGGLVVRRDGEAAGVPPRPRVDARRG
jgi:hypothetical protein